MKYIAILALLASQTSFAQMNAKDIIERSNSEMKKIRSLQMTSYFDSKSFGQVSSEIFISKDKPFPVFGVSRIKMTGVAITSDGSRAISLAYNGSVFSYLDPIKNEVVVIDNPTYQKLGRTGLLGYALGIPSFYYEGFAFDSLIRNGLSYERGEDTVIFGQPSYKINVLQKIQDRMRGDYEFTNSWYIDKGSFLCLGVSNPSTKNFLKIKTTNLDFPEADFLLASGTSIRNTNGLEPLTDGLLKVGTKAPLWKLPSNKTGKIDLEKLRGKVVLLDFWGIWCMPCVKAMPDIQAIFEHFKDQPVEVIGISVEFENAADPSAFVKRNGYTYPIALDGKSITEKYNVKAFPSVYLIDKKGKIIHAEHSGGRENFKSDIIDRINKALLE